MAMSPDGTQVVSGDAYRYIHLWDAVSKNEIAAIADHKDKILDLAWSECGQRVLSCTLDEAFGVIEMSTHEMK